jgi:hypothetical protein
VLIPHLPSPVTGCRFAQRVSLIKNKATINEGSDPELVIKRLKNEVLTLREEIAFLKVWRLLAAVPLSFSLKARENLERETFSRHRRRRICERRSEAIATIRTHFASLISVSWSLH